MREIVKNLFKLLILFIIGGFTYVSIEIAYRCRSHWTMFILGGLCFIILGLINEIFPWDMLFWYQCLIGTLSITLLEFIFGYIFNIKLGMNIWDYSNVPMNFMGQVCLPFSIIWYFLSGIGIVIDDYLRYWLFKEEKPRYKFK